MEKTASPLVENDSSNEPITIGKSLYAEQHVQKARTRDSVEPSKRYKRTRKYKESLFMSQEPSRSENRGISEERNTHKMIASIPKPQIIRRTRRTTEEANSKTLEISEVMSSNLNLKNDVCAHSSFEDGENQESTKAAVLDIHHKHDFMSKKQSPQALNEYDHGQTLQSRTHAHDPSMHSNNMSWMGQEAQHMGQFPTQYGQPQAYSNQFYNQLNPMSMAANPYPLQMQMNQNAFYQPFTQMNPIMMQHVYQTAMMNTQIQFYPQHNQFQAPAQMQSTLIQNRLESRRPVIQSQFDISEFDPETLAKAQILAKLAQDSSKNQPKVQPFYPAPH